MHGQHMITGHPLREEVAELADTLIATPNHGAKKRVGSRHDLLGKRGVVMDLTLRGWSAKPRLLLTASSSVCYSFRWCI